MPKSGIQKKKVAQWEVVHPEVVHSEVVHLEVVHFKEGVHLKKTSKGSSVPFQKSRTSKRNLGDIDSKKASDGFGAAYVQRGRAPQNSRLFQKEAVHFKKKKKKSYISGSVFIRKTAQGPTALKWRDLVRLGLVDAA